MKVIYVNLETFHWISWCLSLSMPNLINYTLKSTWHNSDVFRLHYQPQELHASYIIDMKGMG